MNEKSAPLLERVLRQFPDTPKSRAKQWISAGRVTVNGAVVRKPHQPIDATAVVELGNRHATAIDCGKGWKIHPRVTLLHLDSSLAVVNKGPGLLSVPGTGAELSALSILGDFLEGKLKPRERGLDLPAPYRRLQPLPVHRLDQYTSGVFCLAMNPAARENLISQVRNHTMKREYVAFAEGRPAAPAGIWRDWLELSRDELRQQIVDSSAGGATEAITHYEVLAEFLPAKGRGTVSKLRLRLETGLKHQIRIQAAKAGLPLIGDRTYNKFPSIEFPRQALHAELLGLTHPQTGKPIKWRADLPKDLRDLELAFSRE